MKQNILNNRHLFTALLVLLLAGCSNETEVPYPDSPQSCTIRISVRSGNGQTRANDLLDMEKIHRYDIFIYKPGDAGELVKYISGNNAAGLEEVTETFESSSDFVEARDIYIVANHDWPGKSPSDIEALSKAEVLATFLSCTQNITGQPSQMTAFGGYRKSTGQNEPFVLSVSRTGYNFKNDGYTLDLELKRTYAKVALQFHTILTNLDPDWLELKTVRILAINNLPQAARLFSENGSGFTPTLESYVFQAGSEYVLTPAADLSKGDYTVQPFNADRLALRLFPHDPSGNVATRATSLKIEFEVGAVGAAGVTRKFERLITIGDKQHGYRIDPNHAYIITVAYGKTTNSITTDCRVVPWNLVDWTDTVIPD